MAAPATCSTASFRLSPATHRSRRQGTVANGGSFSATNVGWNVGIAYAFLNNWAAKLEYLYIDLGAATCGAGSTTTNPFDVTLSMQIVRGAPEL